jgi:hypothetical protein
MEFQFPPSNWDKELLAALHYGGHLRGCRAEVRSKAFRPKVAGEDLGEWI